MAICICSEYVLFVDVFYFLKLPCRLFCILLYPFAPLCSTMFLRYLGLFACFWNLLRAFDLIYIRVVGLTDRNMQVHPTNCGTSVDSDRLDSLVNDDAQSNVNHSSRLG